MEFSHNLKAVYIIVNAGFAEDVVEMAREAGAKGATIIHARGTGPVHHEIMGITVDAEKEMILSLVDADTADRILFIIKEKAGIKTPANGICFISPVDHAIAVNKVVVEGEIE